MLKKIATLFRAVTHNATEDFTDRHALLLLQQQLREAAQSVDTARKAVALAMAQNEQEERQCEALRSQIKELEMRALTALEKGKDELAQEAAEIIAALEMELKACEKSVESFSAEIKKLRSNVLLAQSRLKELNRGQRIAAMTDKAHRLRDQVPNNGLSTLNEAEETLVRLRDHQKQVDATEASLQTFSTIDDPQNITEKLAEAGCGPAIKSNADDVLNRLRKQVTKSQKK